MFDSDGVLHLLYQLRELQELISTQALCQQTSFGKERKMSAPQIIHSRRLHLFKDIKTGIVISVAISIGISKIPTFSP